MLTVEVWNREQAQFLSHMEGEVIISISQPNKPAALDDGWHDILRLEFSDITDACWDELNETERAKFTVFDEDMARQVWSFVNKHESRVIHVHCDAGISRSVGVGLVVADTLGRELKLHAIRDSGLANSRVTRILKRVEQARAKRVSARRAQVRRLHHLFGGGEREGG